MSKMVWKVSATFLRYAAVFFAGWMASFLSALVANKGISKIRVVVDSEAGVPDE